MEKDKVKEVLKCKTCGKVYSSRIPFYKHVENCGKDIVSKYVCKICNKQYTSKLSYEKHMLKCSKQIPKKDKKEMILQQLHKNGGVITTTCKELHITPAYYYRLLKEDEKFNEQVEAIKYVFTESKLFELIQHGDRQAIMFYLKTKCKDEGYSEKTESEILHKVENIIINPVKKID